MLKRLADVLVRSIGVIMFAFIPGMASGAATGIGPVMGGLNGVATVFASIIIYFGVQLAWDADLTKDDVERGFRAAVAKQAQDSKEVRQAVNISQDDEITWEDAADFDGEYGDGPNQIGDVDDLDK